jgi:hypothetical protein
VALIAAGLAVVTLAFLLGLMSGSPPAGDHQGMETVPLTVSPTLQAPAGVIATEPPSPPATLNGTVQATSSPTPSGPPGFTVTVSPTQITASRSETVTYTMTIEAQNGFSDKIHIELVASAFFGIVSRTTDLGTQEPPYPKTIEYPFPIPADWPPGITVNGILRSTGGGITREDQITLTVR